MIFAVPVASHGLPAIAPANWVCVLVRELLSTTPLWSTSKRLYVLRETPAALGVWILTSGAAPGAPNTVGRWLPGAFGSPTTCPALAADVTPTQPKATHKPRLTARTCAVRRPSTDEAP